MSPGRLIHISSGGETSSATVIVVILIVAVLGYLVLEHGTGKDGTTRTCPPPAHDADPVNEVELIPIPDIIYTSYTPGPYSDDEASDTEGGDSNKKIDSNATAPRPKGGLKTGNTPRVQKGSVSVGFGGISTETAASDQVGWDGDLPPEGGIYSRLGELEGYKDKWKQNEGVRPQIESRLPLFEKQLEEGGHTDLIMHMKWVGSLVEEDYMRGATFTGAQADRYQRAIADTWIARWVLDIPALVQGMWDDLDIRNSQAAPAGKIILDLFMKKQCVAPKDDLTGQRQRGEAWEVWVTKQPDDEAAILEFLLGWFVLSYRGYEREQWTDQRARRDVGEGPKGSKSGRKHAGTVLSKHIENAVGPLGAEILLWLSWAGRRYHVNRLFTPTGADLLDGTVRASILPLQHDSDEFFKMEVTLFVPESSELQPMDTAEISSHWVRVTPAGDDKSGLWAAFWLRDALMRAMLLAQTWIRYHHTVLDSLGQETQNSLDVDRILLRQLFIRPGYNRDHVQLSKGTTTQQAPLTLFSDRRTPVLVQLDPDVVEKVATQKSGRYVVCASESLRYVLQLMRITTIRFVNRRQNNWYTPAAGGDAADHFDPRQIALMVGLLIFALGPLKTNDLAAGMSAEEYAAWNGAEDDPHRPATTFANTEMAMYMDDGDGLVTSRRPITIDFGPIMPYFPAPGRGALHAMCPWLSRLYRAKIIFLPLLDSASVAQRLIHPGAAPSGRQDNQSSTAAWLVDWGTDMFRSLEANPDKRLVLVTESYMEEHLERGLYKPLDTMITTLFIPQLSQTDKNITNEQVFELIEKFLRTLASSVSITVIAECQTDVNEPRLWPLSYSKDHVKTSKYLIDLYHRNARESGGQGGQNQTVPAGPNDESENGKGITAGEKKRQWEEEQARNFDRMQNTHINKRDEQRQTAEEAKEADRRIEEAITKRHNEEQIIAEAAKREREEYDRAKEMDGQTGPKPPPKYDHAGYQDPFVNISEEERRANAEKGNQPASVRNAEDVDDGPDSRTIPEGGVERSDDESDEDDKFEDAEERQPSPRPRPPPPQGYDDYFNPDHYRRNPNY